MAISQIGGGAISGKASTSLTTTTWTSTSGNTIIVTVHTHTTTQPTAVKDNAGAGNAGSLLTSKTDGASGSWLYKISSSVTGTNSVNVTSASQTYSVEAEEYSGNVGGTGSTNTNNGTGTSATVVLTTINNNDWIAGGAGAPGTGTFSMAAPNTQRQTSGTSGGSGASNHAGDEGDQTVATAGAATLTATISASEAWTMVGVVLLLLAPSGPPPTRTLTGVGK